MNEFPGNRFIALSWIGGEGDPEPEAVGRLLGATDGWRGTRGASWVLRCEREDCFGERDGAAVALGFRSVVDRSSNTAIGARAVAARVANAAEFLAALAPPARLAWSGVDGVRASTDSIGLGQVFTIERDGVAAVSTSATLLADLFDARADHAALVAFALFGAFPESLTPFEDVEKLPAATAVWLRDGTVQRSSLAVVPSGRESDHVQGSLDDILRGSVGGLAAAFPEADLELSGGLDSRLILAAMDPDRRRRHRAITIGVPNSPDVEVARRVAAHERLDHQIVDISGLGALDADSLHALLAEAVIAYDHAANPIDKAALIFAGRSIDSQARFGGQNGEIFRGFFYPAQPLDAPPAAALARRLIRSRLETNDRVDPALFIAAPYAEYRAAAEERMVARLLSFGGPWSATLDRFYLAERMQRWVGNATGNRLIDRAGLYPFFDPAVIARAMTLPAREKANSHAAYALLARLDPKLAALPLDNGRTPATLVGAPARARIADAALSAKRAIGRIRRRIGGGGDRNLGAGQVIDLWHRHRLFERLPVDALSRTGLFDPAALERLHMGSWLPDRPTLGFVLMTAGLVTRSR